MKAAERQKLARVVNMHLNQFPSITLPAGMDSAKSRKYLSILQDIKYNGKNLQEEAENALAWACGFIIIQE